MLVPEYSDATHFTEDENSYIRFLFDKSQT